MFEAVAGWVIWGTMAVGYLAVLALTERSAARFVADPTPACQRTTTAIVNAEPLPSHEGLCARTGLSGDRRVAAEYP